ncbi:MAG: hypothetical protein J6Y94_06910, partial [Bacteriovoracaceae bacterium]|nr:hypothetical protein [Bacteriovoracaceae bacterium]
YGKGPKTIVQIMQGLKKAAIENRYDKQEEEIDGLKVTGIEFNYDGGHQTKKMTPMDKIDAGQIRI